MNLYDKTRESIEFIQEYAPQADKYGGYSVMFSGGKDSQVMLDLFKKSGVNYRAFYCVTTNDPPENVYFIRKHYPDVVFLHPRHTFLELIEKKGMLPTRARRFCCRELKESKGKGFVAVGVGGRKATRGETIILLCLSAENYTTQRRCEKTGRCFSGQYLNGERTRCGSTSKTTTSL